MVDFLLLWATKPAWRSVKFVARSASRAILPPQSHRLRTLRQGDEHFQSQKLQEELALLIDGCYTKSDATTDVATERRERWPRMPRCPVTTNEEVEAGVRHYFRSPLHPDEDYPELVIAFRGTEASREDLLADLAHACAQEQTGTRFEACKRIAWDLIEHYLQICPGMAGRIALTGHSLGAAFALLIWSQFVEDKPTFVGARAIVFNPPHLTILSLLHKGIPGQQFREWFRNSTVTKPVMSVYNKGNQLLQIVEAHGNDRKSDLAQQYMWYARLANFPVVMYVNANDVVCKGVEAFYKRNHNKPHEMHKVHHATLSRLGCIGQLPHFKALVPSVNMFISTMSKGDELASHKLAQWIHPSCLSSSGGADEVGGDAQLFDLRYEEYRLLGNAPPAWNERGVLPNFALRRAGISQSDYEAKINLA